MRGEGSEEKRESSEDQVGLGGASGRGGWADSEKGRLAFNTVGPCLADGPWAVLGWDSAWAVRHQVDPQTCLT